jgi:hypothetical protein
VGANAVQRSSCNSYGYARGDRDRRADDGQQTGAGRGNNRDVRSRRMCDAIYTTRTQYIHIHMCIIYAHYIQKRGLDIDIETYYGQTQISFHRVTRAVPPV